MRMAGLRRLRGLFSLLASVLRATSNSIQFSSYLNKVGQFADEQEEANAEAEAVKEEVWIGCLARF